MPRNPPPHLPEITGAELRRREERKHEPRRGAPLPDRVTSLDESRRLADDKAGLPPGTALCVLCGVEVIYSVQDNRRPIDRDGMLHHDTCQGGSTMTATVDAPLITVGSGPRNARTDPGSGLRYYTWEGRDLPSVTSTRRMAGIPHGLHQWALTKVVDRAIANAGVNADRLATVTTGTPEYAAVRAMIASSLRAAATDERDAAAKLGTAVHDAAAMGRLPADVAPELAPRLAQYRHWLAQSGAEILGAEFQCWNLTAGYAGSCDLLVRLRDGSVWVVDLKTGKGVYSDHALQLIAYKEAEFIGADDVVDERLTALMHTATGMAVLHLADDHWEFRSLRVDAETWRAFRGLLLFAAWSADHQSADSITVVSKRGEATP